MARRRAGKKLRLATNVAAQNAEVAASHLVESEALVVSHWFDPGAEGEPYPATIRLTGKRSGVSGTPRKGDSFEREESIGRVVPGSGPISISTWVYGLTPGEWSVTASLVRPRADARGRRMAGAARPEVVTLPTARWSWRRWSLAPGPATALVRTRWSLVARLARIPGVQPGSVPAFVALGSIIALAVLSAHVGVHGLSIGDALLVTMLASIAGLVGAKLWYAKLHPGEPLLTAGWAVDGFVVVAPLAAVATLLTLGLPVGAYLDDVTPSLFLTVALGRLGCFFTGCCAGRVTSSAWGVWCSDQRIGARRVPTQLLESVAGLLLGVATLVLVLGFDIVGSGAVFAGGFAVYLVIRQFLIRLRADPRRFLWQRSHSSAQTD